jgi:hypothetical protein
MGAGVNGGPVLGHLDQPLGQVEHLARLHSRPHRRRQRRPAMPADRRLMPDHPIGRSQPFERVALVAHLAAARLARPAAKAAQNARLLSQPVARGRLGTRRAVQIQPAPKLRQLRAKTLDLARLRRYQGFDLGPVAIPSPKSITSSLPRDKKDSPRLGSYFYCTIVAQEAVL